MVQKYALYYSLQDEQKTKFEIDSKMLDVVKMYINPMMYSKEVEMLSGVVSEDAPHKNAFFDEISRSGRATGKMPVTKDMEKDIKRLQKNVHAPFDPGAIITFAKVSVDDNSPVVVG
jgi:hypothetical protein